MSEKLEYVSKKPNLTPLFDNTTMQRRYKNIMVYNISNIKGLYTMYNIFAGGFRILYLYALFLSGIKSCSFQSAIKNITTYILHMFLQVCRTLVYTAVVYMYMYIQCIRR